MKYLATIDGVEHELELEALATAGAFQIQSGDKKFEADLQQVGPMSYSVIIGKRSFDFDVIREGDEVIVSSRTGVTRLTLEDARRRLMRAGRGGREVSGQVSMRAMMPGRVINVLVKPGDEVTQNQGVVVIEAMKMENELKSPKAGKVIEVKVAAGQTVEKGELLVVIE